MDLFEYFLRPLSYCNLSCHPILPPSECVGNLLDRHNPAFVRPSDRRGLLYRREVRAEEILRKRRRFSILFITI